MRERGNEGENKLREEWKERNRRKNGMTGEEEKRKQKEGGRK